MRIKAFISISLFLLLLICAVPAYADGIPALPHAFYGTLTLNDAPAPVGTQVSATGTGVITGVPQNPLTTTVAGQYGNDGLYLLVQGNIQDGTTITFYVNGVSTEQTAEWHSGETTQLNLSVTIITPTTTPPGGGGGGGGGLTISTNFFGSTGSININSAGVVRETFTATSPDGKLTITIPKGTKALDRNGNPLSSMTGIINQNPPAPPENANIIGLAYDFGPAGATFSPPITLTWKYDPSTLPAGITEEDLVIAYYDTDTGKWVDLPCTIDKTTHTITAQVSHFTTFSLIGTYKPAAFSLSSLVISPAQVAPGEEVTISVSVTNTGGLQGSYTVILNINGLKEATSNISVAPGSIQTVSFSVTKVDAGVYEVTVDGLSGSFTVVAPPTTTPAPTTPAPTTPTTPAPTTPAPTTPTTPAPTTPTIIPPPTPSNNWPLIGGIIGGIVVVILLVFLFARRRD